MTTGDQLANTEFRLPEGIDRYGVNLRRWQVRDTTELYGLILANIDHLRPYMHWIGFEPQTIQQRSALIERWSTAWAAGGDLAAGIWSGDRVIGSAGLHRRLGPGGLEIGYWVDRDHLRQGVATAAARALTDLAFTIDGIDRVQISHDASNLASARVPAQLGYNRLHDRPSIALPGAAGTGIEGVWLVSRDQWHHRQTPLAGHQVP